MKPGSIRTFFRALIHLTVLRPAVKLFCGVHVSGWENLHSLDRFIIIANHNSHLDTLLLFYLLSVRDIAVTHPVAEETYFNRSRIVFALVRFAFQPVWIQRGHPERQEGALSAMKEKLDAGHNLIVFPEGTRGAPGELLPFKSGVGRLVSQYPRIPIVPVFLSGAERALPKATMLPLPFWSQVVVGPAQMCTGSHRDITEQLQATLVGLSRSGSARRRRRQRRNLKPAPTVAVLGIDGSGKSSVSREAARRLSADRHACLVSDQLQFYEKGNLKPLQPFGLETIRSIVSRYAKSARSLKTYKVPKLAELMLRDRLLGEVDRWYAPDVIVQDGSPLLNMAGWATLYAKDELDDDTLATGIAVLAGERPRLSRKDPVFQRLPELKYLDRLGLAHMRLPRVFVLLDLPPSIACERIAARGGRLQPHETEEKLRKLRDAYLTVHRVIAKEWRIPALVIDGTQPLERAVAEATQFISRNLGEESQDHEPSN
jgi:1-acyl-sn-glycerol-3-phosphate acyltransferase